MIFMIRISGALLIALCGTLLGIHYARTEQKRIQLLTQVYSGMERLCDRVRYGGGEMAYLLADAFSQCDAVVIKEDRAQTAAVITDLSDRRLMDEFFEELGSLEAAEECSRIDMYKSLLLSRLNEVRPRSAERARLFRTLGICAGLAAGILVV